MLVGVIGGDTVTLTQAGTFASKNVGTGIAVTANDSIGGASAGRLHTGRAHWRDRHHHPRNAHGERHHGRRQGLQRHHRRLTDGRLAWSA
jgi:hypothetical protein